MEKELTSLQAYKAMIIFLENIYNMGNSEELAMLLGAMQLDEENMPFDSAYKNDWLNAVNEVLKSN